MKVDQNDPYTSLMSAWRHRYIVVIFEMFILGWWIDPVRFNPPWTIGLALPFSLLSTILVFMDQQITTVIVNRKENKLKKSCG